MLEEVLRYINNRFDRDSIGNSYGSQTGTFTIEGRTMEVDGLRNGQYFWVEGSALNDGLHLYPDTDMRDEVFTGRIVYLVIPNAVVDLAAQIGMWCERNADAISSPLQSESFGGYSYTRALGGSTGNEMPSAAWQVQFGARLRPYRKLSRDWV